MKRRSFKLLSFLITGAVINVAVAWTHAVLVPVDVIMNFGGMFEPADTPTWDIATVRDCGALMIIAQASNKMRRPGAPPCASGPYWSWSARPPSVEESSRELTFEERAYGWPMLSMFARSRGSWWGVDDQSPQGGIRINWSSSSSRSYRILPCYAILPGFAINTIFYAAMLWLFAAPFALRRRIRIKRGQCASCGYSLRGRGNVDSDKCPECGQATLFRATTDRRREGT